MKKHVLLPLLFSGFGANHPAQAQGALINLIGAGINLATLPKRPVAAAAAAPVATVQSAAQVATDFQKLQLQRTAAGQLPPHGAEAIAALETQLERCHAALLADSTSVVCPPAQRVALQQAAVQLAQTNPTWNTLPYQREASFYLNEDARRQLVSAGVRVALPASASAKKTPVAPPPAPVAPVATAAEVATRFRGLKLQRTAAAQLPARGAEPITALETELERCHQAYLADSTGVICPPAQRTALQQAAARLAQTTPGWNALPYQREAAFYLDEDTRRHLVSTGAPVGKRVPPPAPVRPPAPVPLATPAWVPATFRQLKRQRTPDEQLPKRGAEQVKALEAELERCHAALVTDSTGVVCPPAQRTALQQAAVRVAQANPSWSLEPYQRETAFYLAEDIRRQQAAKSAK
ncbi:hypothetical protein MON38_10420 [Hymenobacter sp. DH14]|uniref:Uncharacterized protein n=1 Tax=Hymenobacter cyanobacteriorum TaxID=2926463 RepID=A0A9X1VER2_9BACT|nr:hypothetical protein [Hymenobacter cyanobacteriorum]MCI1187834.1 hypothetical protein [Hymenobacter cyanobacteriorum]